MKIGIIVALSVEHEQLAKLLENKAEREEFPFKYVEGSMGGNEIILTQCGIGKVNAAMGTVELIRRLTIRIVLHQKLPFDFLWHKRFSHSTQGHKVTQTDAETCRQQGCDFVSLHYIFKSVTRSLQMTIPPTCIRR